jgi:aspartyl-tRNA(Asn)/glutamyl-tRNA(Gln) amidotransferase subunit B
MKEQDVLTRYRPTIGIECHVQLKTKTKLFSGADNDARDAAPNITVSPICFGFPGVLPVLNDEALTLAIRAGIALNAEIPEISRFERKHYFYPDLPKGYQTTQLAEPVIKGGTVQAVDNAGSAVTVRIHHAHLEEDAGKLTHPATQKNSYVDLNRAGTPLIEIVSEPDMHSPQEARAFTQELYRLMTFADVTHGDLYRGNMRFDVNISLSPLKATELGTRAEIKNLNSFRAVEKAAEFEIIRQAKLLDSGQEVIQETRGWNDDKQETFSQRSKEDAHDYRYFPDPDIPVVRIKADRVESVRASMPPLPAFYRSSWESLGLDDSVINVVLSSVKMAQTIQGILVTSGEEHARRVAHWFVSSSDTEQTDKLPEAVRLVELSQMVADEMLSSTAAKQVYAELFASQESANSIAKSLQLLQDSDVASILAIVKEVLSSPNSQKAVADVSAGNDKAIGYLVGQVMKLSSGTANPAIVQKIIRQEL